MAKIFVTGGAGYIGSHTVLRLIESGYDVTVFDNLEYGSEKALDRIRKITGKDLVFIKGDIRSSEELGAALKEDFDAIIHFAAYKNVSDSMKRPDAYYENNVVGSLNILKIMKEKGIHKIVFSSSCSVHGQPKSLPVKETDELAPLSPYARTKLAVEYMLDDFKNVDISSVRLRYFNAAGAHPSGEIGENPEVLLNIIPRVFGSALGKYELKIFGNKFETPDGFQVRDYIHVMDLADGHVLALKYLENNNGSYVFGLGTGKGTSNLQIIQEVEAVTGKSVKYDIVDPIAGDPVQVYGDNTKARTDLGWEPKYGYKEIIRDAWNWYKNNPEGYK